MRNRTALLFVGAGLGALVLLSGCNPKDAQNITQDTRQLAQHTGEALGSATLAGKVTTVLSLRKGVDMGGIHVDADNGVVTLGGHVRNAEERQRVVATVNQIRGVDKVVNNLRIGE